MRGTTLPTPAFGFLLWQGRVADVAHLLIKFVSFASFRFSRWMSMCFGAYDCYEFLIFIIQRLATIIHRWWRGFRYHYSPALAPALTLHLFPLTMTAIKMIKRKNIALKGQWQANWMSNDRYREKVICKVRRRNLIYIACIWDVS